MFCSGFCVCVYPLWEGRHTMKRTVLAIYNDVTGKKSVARRGTLTGQEVKVTGASTPTEKVTETTKAMQ
jgi:hypothetical protein